MNVAAKTVLLALLVLAIRQPLFSQYILNGSATQNSCNCYTLTPAQTTQSGSVWNNTKINLTSSFDFWFNVYLGCNDASGADGIVFMLQPISTSVGTTGQGMGFEGVSPSIGVALDTWQNSNLNDPSYDHISIQSNGNVNHNNDLVPPVQASSISANIEDCQWHKLRITWDASTKWMRTYFDGVLRLEKQVDLVATIFNNNPLVYWGFSGATGGSVNLQQFCTALDPLFKTDFTAGAACDGIPVRFTDASESFAPITSYNWSFGDGATSTAATPPPHLYPGPGDYKVTLKVRGQDGCERDSSRTIKVAAKPTVALQAFDTCFGKPTRYGLLSDTASLRYTWSFGGVALTGSPSASISNIPAGSHRLDVTATSLYGCGSPATASANFVVKPVPVVTIQAQDGCANEMLSFEGGQTDNATTIQQWQWRIENRPFTGQTVQHAFAAQGSYTATLQATADNGCVSEPLDKSIRISQAFIRSTDTTLLRNRPAVVQVQSNGSVLWQPATGLSNPSILNPVVTLGNDQAYIITATTPEGCTAEDTLLIKVFNAITVYVPTAFTPNADGRNDVLLPVYAGIRELKQFAVYNRWGQRLFFTKDMLRGWEGSGASGTFVWLVEAVDVLGQPVQLKGTVTVIR